MASCSQDMNVTYSSVTPVLESFQACFLLLVGFGGLAILLAFLYNWIQARVFGDVNNLDRAFDAGGNVSTSLTAVTVAVQYLWPADMLQGATITARFGMAGGFWYSIAVVGSTILFPILSITFKNRAPGAKTYLQVIKARFGKRTHIVFSVFALVLNIVVISIVLTAAHALFKSLINGMSDALIFIIIATLFGSYAFIGGVGSTFYVSYVNGAVTFILLCYYIVKLFYISNGDNDELPFGTLSYIYDKIASIEGNGTNQERNYLTFLSMDYLVWVIQGVILAANIAFCDQASWQSRIAAKPLQGVLGFFFATFIWFAVPVTIGTTSGLIYLAYTDGGTNANALSDDDIDAGLVTCFIAQRALGDLGGLMIITMFTMLMMGTGSGEIMAVASIIVYDIYQTYICPFKDNAKPGHCILCDKKVKGNPEKINSCTEDKRNIEESNFDNYCQCPDVHNCQDCKVDLLRQEKTFMFGSVAHCCPIHGEYRLHQDAVIRVKNWLVLAISLALVPLGLILVFSGVDLNWLYVNGSVVIAHMFSGVIPALIWVKTRGWALVVGGIAGLLAGVTALLIRASALEGGLANFFANTSEGFAIIAGTFTSCTVSLCLTIGLSALTHQIKTPEDADREWQKVLDIDNPLRPWKEQFREEFPHIVDARRPSYEDMSRYFRKAKTVAKLGTVLCIILFVVLIPGIMASMGDVSGEQFQGYLVALQIWTLVMACLIVLMVPVEEILQIGRQLKKSSGKRVSKRNGVFALIDKNNDGTFQDDHHSFTSNLKEQTIVLDPQSV